PASACLSSSPPPPGISTLSLPDALPISTRRLLLTGTPFRSDDNPIPFVTYEPDGAGLLRSRADSWYGYAEALADGVVRPVIFLADRKSTRLNSSHVKISYAVFCLKKKIV